MKLVNRAVLVLKPTAKMLDWINSVGEESTAVTLEVAQEMDNANLLPDEAWCTDPGKWPSVRNHKAFFAWFRVDVSPMVFDLAGDPIVLQPLNLTK